MSRPANSPRRLLAKRPPRLPRAPELPGRGTVGRFARLARAAAKSALSVGWTSLVAPPQALMMRLPGAAKGLLPGLYWRGICRILDLSVRRLGAAPASHRGRGLVYVSNHSSWLDVAVLGGTLDACFVAKADVARWPVVGTIARLGRTEFVSRQRGSTLRERDAMVARLTRGDDLILFPEGTTSDGSRVLPFRSSFLAIVEPAQGPPPLVQPISIVYDRLAGLPAGRTTRPLFAYYGDMAIGPHFWRIAAQPGLRASVLLHPPLDPADYPDRKALSRAIWQIVADGAATLRQNRLPR